MNKLRIVLKSLFCKHKFELIQIYKGIDNGTDQCTQKIRDRTIPMDPWFRCPKCGKEEGLI